ncbi:unnamed protein product [Lactuca virosa]|uniref:Uncharacterized protein n=1 Tax=Lactuca virosa TaxID=75947 RepID=A0AAU9NME9_9ASTR|nr:unnamed protein product [Lactuca virosa]
MKRLPTIHKYCFCTFGTGRINNDETRTCSACPHLHFLMQKKYKGRLAQPRTGTSKEHENEDKEFEDFERYKAMKKRCEENENQKKEMRDKEWDYVSIHTDQSSDSCDRRSK